MARKALIVEDEIDTGQLLAEHLRRWNYQPTIITEGQLAVAWVKAHQPDVILLDLLLPGMDGFAICEAVKLDRETNLIPIVMITALDQSDDRLHGLRVGANKYLTKPFTPHDLHQSIDEVFSWREELLRRGTEGEVQFKLQSDTQYLDQLNQMLSSLFLFTGLTQHQVKQLTMAVRELGTNAIEWGHRKQVELVLKVVYRIDPEKVTITICDKGPGFNPRNLPHAAKLEDPVTHMMIRETLGLRDGGFGILMARGLVDELEYNDKGNEVRLVKKFPAHARLSERFQSLSSPACK